MGKDKRTKARPSTNPTADAVKHLLTPDPDEHDQLSGAAVAPHAPLARGLVAAHSGGPAVLAFVLPWLDLGAAHPEPNRNDANTPEHAFGALRGAAQKCLGAPSSPARDVFKVRIAALAPGDLTEQVRQQVDILDRAVDARYGDPAAGAQSLAQLEIYYQRFSTAAEQLRLKSALDLLRAAPGTLLTERPSGTIGTGFVTADVETKQSNDRGGETKTGFEQLAPVPHAVTDLLTKLASPDPDKCIPAARQIASLKHLPAEAVGRIGEQLPSLLPEAIVVLAPCIALSLTVPSDPAVADIRKRFLRQAGGLVYDTDTAVQNAIDDLLNALQAVDPWIAARRKGTLAAGTLAAEPSTDAVTQIDVKDVPNISTEEAARRLGLSAAAVVRAYIREGKFGPDVKIIGGAHVLTEKQFAYFLANRKGRGRPAKPDETTDPA